MQLSGLLREFFGIAGLDAHTATILRNKIKMKDVLSQKGFRCPRYILGDKIGSFCDFQSNSQNIVIKPILGSNSENCMLIKPEDFDSKLLAANLDYASIIIEEYIDGAEYHADALVAKDGKVIFSCVSKDLYPMIRVTHDGAICGSVTSNKFGYTEKKILDILNDIITSLGIKRSIVHAEFLQGENSNEIYVSEIAGRPGGDKIVDNIRNVFGVDIIEKHILESKDELTMPIGIPNDTTKAGAYILLPIKKGIVLDFTSRSILENTEGVVDAKYNYRRGDEAHLPEWLIRLNANPKNGIAKGRYNFGHVLIVCENVERCIKVSEEVFSKFSLVTLE